MKILITGACGFVGKNLRVSLPGHELLPYDLDTEPSLLDGFCRDADFVFHLAGVNRPDDPEKLMEGNFGFTSMLLLTLKKHGNTCPVVLSSSAQAALDSYSTDISKYFQSYRWQILACAGAFLALRVASGLLADPLLRRKIWENIGYAHEEGVTADGPGQRFGRHQLLIRLGGFSLITPVLCYWALRLLPGIILDALTWITK